MEKDSKKDSKILLVNPAYGRQHLSFSMFPLGLSYITQSLIDEGYKNVQVKDFVVQNFEEEKFVEFLKGENFDVVCLTGLVIVCPAIKMFAEIIKDTLPEAVIVLGGGIATAYPAIVLKNTKIDIVVIGEGEQTIRKLINTVVNGGDLETVDGIGFFDSEKKICKTAPAKFIENLDDISFPDRDSFSFGDYVSSSNYRTFQKKSRIVKMFTSRGCPFACGYCFQNIWGHPL